MMSFSKITRCLKELSPPLPYCGSYERWSPMGYWESTLAGSSPSIGCYSPCPPPPLISAALTLDPPSQVICIRHQFAPSLENFIVKDVSHFWLQNLTISHSTSIFQPSPQAQSFSSYQTERGQVLLVSLLRLNLLPLGNLDLVCKLEVQKLFNICNSRPNQKK